ncbi:MAG TPA: uridine phosphorylase [Anaerolineae bacterium]|nr:uridine phosphorylase [Anaerolineae bacterium]
MHDANLQYHVQLGPGDVGRYVLLPGDPGRCEKIAAYFDNPVHIASNREYTTYTGTLLGEKVSVTSTGIGGPSAAIAVEELAKLEVDTFIRVGTAGGMQPFCRPGDLAIVTGAIRDEGTSLHYMPIEFPAVANLQVVSALRQAAQRVGARAHLGISQSKDSFYGEIEPARMPVAPRLQRRWKAWVDGGAICSEMEAATIFIVASVLGKRAGGVMFMGGSTIMSQEEYAALAATLTLDQLIQTAVEAVKILIEQDRGRS